MPVRTSVAQLGVIAGLLLFLVAVVGKSGDGTRVEVFKVALLLATLTVLCGLVLIMRTTLDQLALGIRGSGSQRFRSVLLEAREFEAALNTELSRAGRHERPLSVLLLEVVGTVKEAQGRQRRNAIAGVARSIVERIRIEDSVGHFDDMRFGVIAPETTSAGVAAMAATVAGVVRERLIVAGFEGAKFDVAVGWAEFPHRATTREGLMAAAQDALEASKREGAEHGAATPQGAPAAGSPGPQSA
jgi:GGDEF domain-containing protein